MADLTIPDYALDTKALEHKLASIEAGMKEETDLLTHRFTNLWREAVVIRNILTNRKRRKESE